MRLGLVICAVSVTLVSAGCVDLGNIMGGTIVLPDTSNLTLYTDQEQEANDDFATAQTLSLPSESAIDVTANLSGMQDVDVYDLGAVAAGERITVAVDCGSSLDLAAAVFDDQQYLLSTNDDRAWQVDVRPSLAVTLRHDTQHCYVAIAASSYADSAAGDYTVRVLREPSTAPATRSQTIYLNFSGGQDIILPDATVADIPAFDAANIDSSYAGQTSTMTAAIVSGVRNDFAPFNVQIVSSSEGSSCPANATTLYFGLYNPNLLGLAESVDEYNTDLTQMAIIFADTFRLFMPLQPTVEEMATAIANVASHEAGHLLGLEHTIDWEDLMDTTAPADALLVDQVFKAAPLYEMIFPIGYQDGAMLLTETLGASPNAAAREIDRSALFANTVASADNRPSVNTGVVPSSGRIVGSAGAWADIRRLLLHGQRSGQGYVSKDLFAVHSRGSHSR